MSVTDASPPLESPMTVLVVEDDFLLREATVETLNDLGYHAVSAGDAGQALAALDLSPEIAILVADIGLPVMNGLELAAEARRRRPGLGVLFVTGYTRPARIGALAPGDLYLLKPYAPAALAKALRQLSNTASASANGSRESAPPGHLDPSAATAAGSVLTQP